MVSIRNANNSDKDILTSIAFKAKGVWNYPSEYFKIWKNELTITQSYINENIVRCLIIENTVIGFYSLCIINDDTYFGEVSVEKGIWLDHMFILPEYHKNGFGTLMFNDLKRLVSQENRFDKIKIFVDPYAKGFYIKMGARIIRYSKSSIPDRRIPVFEYIL